MRPAGRDFSPLDEQLQLLPGCLSPTLHEYLVRLGTWMPFAEAAGMLEAFSRVAVSEPTARRLTEQAGAAYVQLQTAEVERLERETPPAPAGGPRQQLSADGAFVPLLKGKWAEVKTLAIAELHTHRRADGQVEVRAERISYFSRRAECADFDRLATVETHHRGVERAEVVAAVMDGAEWLQGLVDWQCPQAVRILDFMHAAEYLSRIAQAGWASNEAEWRVWLSQQCHALKQDGPEGVLQTIRALQAAHPHLEDLPPCLAYLEKRLAQMQYPAFLAQHLPIGSGMVESANKLVVLVRLKGAGMHWALVHVDPMVALRTIVCSNRWNTDWPLIHARLLVLARQRRHDRRLKRQAPVSSPAIPAILPTPDPLPLDPQPAPPQPSLPPPPSAPPAPHKPAPNHPWRASGLFSSRSRFSKN